MPVFEISDEMLSEIDIHDGEIGDWLAVIGEPSLTGLDLTANVSGGMEEYDPSDLDFRIWLAWHRGLNRIYIAAEGVDDVLVDRDDDGEWYWDGVIGLEIDGDHSGGIYVFKDGDESQWQGVQHFVGGPLGYLETAVNTPSTVRPEYCTIGSPDITCWFTVPPFADVGGATYGENPTVWMTEMYVTPFDWLVDDDRDETVISELRPDGIVGLRVAVHDDDDPQNRGGDAAFLFPAIDHDSAHGPDQFADGLLVPVGGRDSAKESVSWGRIKASLQP